MEQAPVSIADGHSAVTSKFPLADDGCATSRRGRVTLETLLYGLILVAAILTRFWDLGSRALHHDESLHAYFSWVYAEGYGYIHNPLMHGPALFHANALFDLLLGATDATSRIAPAILGVVIVMLPWLLRSERLLGRWGALVASTLLLISPSILYYSRFERHDIYCLAGTFALFVAILRYVESREPKWAFLAALTVGYLLTTEEVSFIVLFAFVLFLGTLAIYRVAPVLFGVIAGAGVFFLVVVELLKLLGAAPLPSIPWENPTNANVRHFTVQLLTHPDSVAALGIALLALVAAIWLLDRRRDRELGWLDGLFDQVPAESTAGAIRDLLAHPRGFLWGAGLGLLFFVLLYSSLFMNMAGLASGTFGALGYWLGQQGVQRGEEPWFYYLLLLPQYEFIAVTLLPICAAWLIATLIRGRRTGLNVDRVTYVRGFLLWWALCMLAVLSWAGEKMPWISIHVDLPLTLLAASYLGTAIDWFERSEDRRKLALLGALTAGALAAGFLLLAWGSAGPYIQGTPGLERTLRPAAVAHWWPVILAPWVIALAATGFAVWKLGLRMSLITVMLAATLMLGLAELHAGWRMTYDQGDVPLDMLIYVQTSPDVPRLANDLTALSEQTTGGMNLEVWYDDTTQWPLNWYLRDFPYRHYFGTQLPNAATQPMSAPVVIVSDEYVTPAMDAALANYTPQEYPLRWWFPEEETYRRFAYAPDLKNAGRQNYQDARTGPFSLLDTAESALRSIASLRHPSEQGRIFRLVAFREVPAPVGSVRFRVYIRKDLVPTYDAIHYGSDR